MLVKARSLSSFRMLKLQRNSNKIKGKSKDGTWRGAQEEDEQPKDRKQHASGQTTPQPASPVKQNHRVQNSSACVMMFGWLKLLV